MSFTVDEKGDSRVIVCLLKSEAKEAYVPSVIRLCCGCGEEVYVSKGSLEIVEERKLQTSCMPCALSLAEESGDSKEEVLKNSKVIHDGKIYDLKGNSSS